MDFGLSYAGQLKFDGVPVDITTSSNEDLVIAPAEGGNTQIGDASGTNTNAASNDDLHITGNLESDGAGYFDSSLRITGALSANGSVTLGDASSDSVTFNAANLSLANASTLNLANSSARSLNIESGLLNLDTSNGRIGIGTTNPGNKLTVSGSIGIGTTSVSSTYLTTAGPDGGMLIEGNVGIGTTAPAASSLLEISSTTKGFLLPRMTTTQRNAISSPATGLMIYNTSINAYNVYNGTSWEAVGTAGAPSDATYITQTANTTLTAEQALGDLSSGIMRVATTTGIITSLTDSAGLAANISDETGSGAIVFGTSPTLTTPAVETSLTLTDDDWLGLGSAAGRLELDNQATDEVNILDANVGIGNSNPTQLLQVGTSPLPGLVVTASRAVGIGNTAPVGTLQVGTSPSTGFTILTSGNVGIGTTNPGSLFSVGANAFTVDSTGTVTAGTWNGTAIASGYIDSNAILATEIDTLAELETIMGGTNIIASTEIDTLAELETIMGSINILAETEIDASSELLAIMDDETGTGALTFATAPTFTTSITDPLLIGGTATTSTLTLRSTSGAGTTNADIIFQTGTDGGTEAMRILNSGRLGIGTASPTQLFQVGTSPNPGLVVTASGNVGIGTTGPAYTLDVNGNGRIGGITLNSNVLTAQKVSAQLTSSGHALAVSTTGALGTDFAVYSSQGKNYFGGNVGIGTTSLTQLLQVGTSPNPGLVVTAGGSVGIGNTAPIGILHIGTNPSTGLVVLNSGNLGIGTTNPGSLLTVGADAFTVNSTGTVTAGTWNGTAIASGYIDSNAVLATEIDTLAELETIMGGTNIIASTEVDTLAELETIMGGINILAETEIDASSELLAIMDDETGTGALTFATAPVFITSITDPLLIGGTATTSALTLRSTSGAGTTGADIIFQTGSNGGTEAMRILNSGSFGIGTASPTQLFQVGTSPNPALVVTASRSVGIGTTAPVGTLQVGTSPSTGFTILTSGNVGIGTTNPGSLFSIGANAFTVDSTGSVTAGTWSGTAIGSASLDTAVILSTEIDTLAELETIMGGTNIIASTEIDSSSELAAIIGDETGSGAIVFGTSPTLTNPVITNIAPGADFTLTQNSVAPFTSVSSGAIVDTMYLNAGKVGIGTNTPAQLLQAGTSPLPGLVVTASRAVGIGNTAPVGILQVGTSPSTGFTILTSGNVGIGTTAPGAKLEIAGSTYQTGLGQSTFFGYEAGLNDDLTDRYNTFIGYQSGRANTAGYYNAANGYASLFSNTLGINNTANGNQSLSLNTTGSSNTASGYLAGRYIADGTTGNTTGDYNVFLGMDTRALADNDQNEIVIGYFATGIGSNSVVLGNNSIITTALKGNVGIGTTNPTKLLQVGTSPNPALVVTASRAVGIGNTTPVGILHIGTSPSTGLVVLNSGNVGIGTTNPGSLLSIGANAFTVDSTGTVTAGTWSGTAIGSASLDTAVILSTEIDTLAELETIMGGTNIIASTEIDTLAELETIMGGINILAETEIDASSELLAIMDDETGTGALTFATAPVFTTSITDPLLIGGTATTSALTLRSTSGAGTTGADIIFQTGTDGGTEAMRILNSGSFGIGTASPVQLLQVGTSPLPGLVVTASRAVGIGNTTPVGMLHIGTSPSTGLVVLNSGNVGIGTTAPGSSLEVNGSMAIPQGTNPTVDAAGEIAIETTDDQLIYGATPRVLVYEFTKCAIIENLLATDDNKSLGMWNDPVTITGIGVHCDGTCTTAADIDLSDRAANAMTHGAPTVSTGTGSTTFTAVTAANSLTAGEGLEFSVANAVSPETDTYTICITNTYDRQ